MKMRADLFAETKKKLVGEVLWIRLVADNLSCIGVMISAYLVSMYAMLHTPEARAPAIC